MSIEHLPKFTRSKRKRKNEWATADPLFYHRLVSFICLLDRTDKAIHIQYTKDLSIWVPLSICREIEATSMYVHAATFEDIKKRALADFTKPPSTFKMPEVFKW